MGLKKGQTNNPAGRPTGVPNKTTTELRERIRDLIDANWDNIGEWLAECEPHQRLLFIKDLLVFSTPKMQSVRAEIDCNLTPHEMQLRQIDEGELIAALMRGGALLGLLPEEKQTKID